MSRYGMTERPSVVTAASVLLYIFAAIGILGGLILLGSGTTTTGLGAVVTLLLLGLSVAYLVFATMILNGSNGARITTIVLLSISIVLNLVDLDDDALISIGLGLLVIGLLAWNRDAQEYFRTNRSAVRSRRRPQRGGLERGKGGFVLAFLLLPVGLYALYVVSPYAQAIYISLTDWTGLTADQTFIGFDNYARLWEDEQFWVALRNNGILLVVVPAVTVMLGLFFASMLNVGRRGKSGIGGVRGAGVYKVVYFFPQVLSVAIVGVLFKYVFAPTEAGGIVNGMLNWVGLDALATPWLGDPAFAFWCVVVVMIWSFVGFYVVLFSAAMQSIPKDIYEAALLDGSNRYTTFRHVTLPLVWDTVQVGWVYLAIQAMDGFALVHVMLGISGGPSRAGDVLGVALYRAAFNRYRFGYASAIGVVLLLLTLLVAVLFLRAARRERVELQ